MRVLLTSLIVLLTIVGLVLYFAGGNAVTIDGNTATVKVPCTVTDDQPICDAIDARTLAWLEEEGYTYSHLDADTARATMFKDGNRYFTGHHVYEKTSP